MNKSTKYKALLIERIDTEDEEGVRLSFSLIDIDRRKSLKELYNNLKCDNIDIQERVINGKIYDFIFDGEYLINSKAEKSENAVAMGIYNGEIKEIIFGNLIICGQTDNKGAETSLNDADIENILTNARQSVFNNKLEKRFEMIIYNF